MGWVNGGWVVCDVNAFGDGSVLCKNAASCPMSSSDEAMFKKIGKIVVGRLFTAVSSFCEVETDTLRSKITVTQRADRRRTPEGCAIMRSAGQSIMDGK